MMTRLRRPRRGVALLLLLVAIAILTVLAVEVAHRAQLNVRRSARVAQDLAFKRAFDSAKEAARGLLIESRTVPAFDYLGDAWSRPLNFDLGDGVAVRLRIQDESGKLNLRDAEGQSPTARRTRQSIARIFAFLTRHDAARAEHWKELEAQVRARVGMPPADAPAGVTTAAPGATAPLQTLDGLREAGVPMDAVFGRTHRADDVDADGEVPALSDLFTTFGNGMTNLNTAPQAVLYGLDEEFDDALTESIVRWRGGSEPAGSASFRAFKNPAQLELVSGIVRATVDKGVPQTRSLYAKVRERVTVRSSCFSAKIEVRVGAQARMGWAFFDVADSVPGAAAKSAVTLRTFEEIEP